MLNTVSAINYLIVLQSSSVLSKPIGSRWRKFPFNAHFSVDIGLCFGKMEVTLAADVGK